MTTPRLLENDYQFLTIFDDGYPHEAGSQPNLAGWLTYEGFLAPVADVGYRITLKGEAALTEYRRELAHAQREES